MGTVERLSSYLVVLALAFVVGCNPPTPATIQSPVSGSVHDVPPLFQISYQSKPARITLNGGNVQQFFAFGDTSATADSADFAPYLKQGSNRLQVSPPNGAYVDFTYDSTGPVVIIEKVMGTQPITVQGRLIDPSGPASVVVNGEQPALDEDDRFIVQLQDSDFYTFVAEDEGGKVSETVIAAPEQQFDRIVTTRVAEDGINFIAEELTPLLNDVDVSAMLPDINRELADKLAEDLALVDLFAKIEITGLDWSQIQVGMDIKPSTERGVIGFDARILELLASIDLKLFGSDALTIPVDANIGFTQATGNAEVFGQEGRLGLEITEMLLSPEDLDLVLAGYDTVIIDALANLLMPALEGILSKFIEGFINEILEEQLAELGDEVSLAINDREMAMTPLFQSFSSDDTTLHVVLGGGIAAKTFDTGAPQVLGSLYTADPLPDAPNTGSHILAHVSTNLVNQAFMVAYQTGLTHFALTNRAELQIGTERSDEIGEVGTERILIDPQSPPFLQIADVSGDPAVTLGLNGLKLAMQKKRASGFVDMFETELDLKASVVLGVNEDDTLRIDFAGSPEVELRDIVIFDSVEVKSATINQIIKLVMPLILPEIAKATQSIEIPSILSYQIIVDDFSAVGDNGSHLGVGITLANANAIACPEGTERYNNKCWDECREGFVGVGSVCWSPRKETYGRGVGTIPALDCGADDLDGALCYPQCRAGYTGVGPVCWLDNASYGRGVGTPLVASCGPDEERDGGLCYEKCADGYDGVGPVCWDFPKSYGRGAGTVPSYGCDAGMEEDAGLCYVECADGYHGVGPVCWSNEELSYGRTAGYIPAQVCGANEELDAGLCYQNCDAGYNGVGPVCWAQDIEPYDRTIVLE